MVAAKVLEASVFIATLGVVTGYIYRDNAGALRRRRRSSDTEEED